MMLRCTPKFLEKSETKFGFFAPCCLALRSDSLHHNLLSSVEVRVHNLGLFLALVIMECIGNRGAKPFLRRGSCNLLCTYFSPRIKNGNGFITKHLATWMREKYSIPVKIIDIPFPPFSLVNRWTHWGEKYL